MRTDDWMQRGLLTHLEHLTPEVGIRLGHHLGITDDQLPFQFGRNAGSGNDVVVVPEGTPADEAASVSRAWFYIQKDALGNYMVYSAELSGDGKKRQSEKKKLVVENGNTWKAMHTVKLQSEVRLKADQFQVILDVENPGES